MASRHSTKAALIPAAAYFRMSTDRQDKSIAEQREELEPWAKENGYQVSDRGRVPATVLEAYEAAR